MYADTVEKCLQLVDHPQFGYARWDYNDLKNLIYVYNDTPNNDGPARGRVFAGVADADIMVPILKQRGWW
jgi:hypothetical protein